MIYCKINSNRKETSKANTLGIMPNWARERWSGNGNGKRESVVGVCVCPMAKKIEMAFM